MTRKPRWKRRDWAAHALAQLGAHGPEGITIEALCTSAGRTRGSLYHHFEDHDELLMATVEHWRAEHTEALIEALADAPQPAARLNELATTLDVDVEIGVRRLAATRPTLRAAVLDVDERRITTLTALHERAGASPPIARDLAALEYAAFIGAQHLAPLFPPGRLAELYTFFETLTSSITE